MSSYTIPTVVESTARGERVADIYSRLLADRIVFIGTPIDDGVANVIVAQLLHLASVQPDRDIHLYINSPGGSFTTMMAIYDTTQYVSADVAPCASGRPPRRQRSCSQPAHREDVRCSSMLGSCSISPTPSSAVAR